MEGRGMIHFFHFFLLLNVCYTSISLFLTPYIFFFFPCKGREDSRCINNAGH